MKYCFDEAPVRIGLESAKWDELGTAASEEVVPLSVADMEFLSPPEIVEELKKTAEFGMWGYSWWGERYFQALHKWMKERHDWDISKDLVVQTNGVVQGLYAAVRAFTEEGDGVILQTPVYYPFYRAVEMNQRVVLENRLKLIDGAYEIDFEDLAEKAKKAKMLILCSPHNPVGRVWTMEELKRIGDICLENNVLVVSDEIHFDFVFPGNTHTIYACLGEKYAQNCIIGTAPSKTFSLAGLCCANMIIPNPEIKAKFEAEVNLSGCYTYSIFGLRALEVGYTKCGPWVDELLEYLYGNYQYFKAFMKENFPKVWVADLQGTYLLWFDCSSFGMNGKELMEFLRQDAKLYFDDGYIFGEQGEGFERINLACPRHVLEKSLERLKIAAKQRGII